MKGSEFSYFAGVVNIHVDPKKIRHLTFSMRLGFDSDPHWKIVAMEPSDRAPYYYGPPQPVEHTRDAHADFGFGAASPLPITANVGAGVARSTKYNKDGACTMRSLGPSINEMVIELDYPKGATNAYKPIPLLV